MSDLTDDLKILEEMTAGMQSYLTGSSLYGQKIDHNLMPITLGGYFLRRLRLQALQDQLSPAERDRLSTALNRFDLLQRVQSQAVTQKAKQELKSRLQQWSQAITELFDGRPSLAFYRNDVEKRAIIAALITALEQMDATIWPDILSKLDRLDQSLQQRWQSGDFLWPAELAPAYPPHSCWWLHGQPA